MTTVQFDAASLSASAVRDAVEAVFCADASGCTVTTTSISGASAHLQLVRDLDGADTHYAPSLSNAAVAEAAGVGVAQVTVGAVQVTEITQYVSTVQHGTTAHAETAPPPPCRDLSLPLPSPLSR